MGFKYMDRIDRSRDFDVVRYGRGTVWYVDFGIDDKKRPAIVMSVNRNYPEVAVIPLTTQQQQDLPWNVKISMPDRESIAKCNGLQKVNVKSICYFVGVVSDEVMTNLEIGVCAWLGIKLGSENKEYISSRDNYAHLINLDDSHKNINVDSDYNEIVEESKESDRKGKSKYIRWTVDLINEYLSDYSNYQNEEEFLQKWGLSSLDAAKKTSYRIKKRLKVLSSKS